MARQRSPAAEGTARGARFTSARAERDRHTTTVVNMPARDLAVYDGRRLVGLVRPIGSIYSAYIDGGRFLGRYGDQLEATRAVPSRRRARRRA
jgi:hypothetical protein